MIPGYKLIIGRLLPYWATVFTSIWILCFLVVWPFEKAYEFYVHRIVEPLLRHASHNVQDLGSNLVGFLGPTIVLTCLCSLLLTDSKLPNWRLSWMNKTFSTVRRHRRRDAEYGHDLAKNQVATGDLNFNFLSFWLIAIPSVILCLGSVATSMKKADIAAQSEGKSAMLLRWEYTSYLCGWVSTICLVWFLIPVSRHSILLVAMGWSPIHALRIHIWAGYLSFIYMFLHAFILVCLWFTRYDYPVWKQIIPAEQCWTWHPDNNRISPPCNHVYWNLTGLIAAGFFFILWGTSLEWVRRRNYRLFYWSHVVCGTMMLLCTILHMQYFALYLLPSSTYYLASTMPTLIQALASRFRGGVKISKVIVLPSSGGCVEVHVATNKFANAELDKEPCLFVKLCVPAISLIWHPFTVYKHRNDPTTVRFLFRPVGPFTTKLSELLTSPVRPITIMDGFYRGADRSEQAMQHDCVTIVAGGVAITPYLSMIPSLLARIQKSGSDVITNHVIVHWACRERGLADFIVQRYINDAMDMAKLIVSENFRLEVKIYLTAHEEKEPEIGADCESTIASGKYASSYHCQIGMEHAAVGAIGLVQSQVPMENLVQTDSRTLTGVEDSSTPLATRGHWMELGRMMPGRYRNIVWNLPLFLAISLPTWFMCRFVFLRYESKEQMSYYDYTQMTWATIQSGCTFVLFAILVEALVLALRRCLPQPRLDDFGVEEFLVTREDAEIVSTDNVTLEFLTGRPTPEAILEAARLSMAPGIFMCGPVAMTKGIRNEASKENSWFGLTRYALYDEPFEV